MSLTPADQPDRKREPNEELSSTRLPAGGAPYTITARSEFPSPNWRQMRLLDYIFRGFELGLVSDRHHVVFTDDVDFARKF